MFHTCKVHRIPGSRQFLPVESEILGFGIQNLVQGILNTARNFACKIRNPGLWNLEKKIPWKNGIRVLLKTV